MHQRCLTPLDLFFHFCLYGICLDHHLLIDLMSSPETDCLKYLLRITKCICLTAQKETQEEKLGKNNSHFLEKYKSFLSKNFISQTLTGDSKNVNSISSSSGSLVDSSGENKVAILLVHQEMFVSDQVGKKKVLGMFGS